MEKKMKTLTDDKFKKLFKKYGSKTMEVFSINEVFKYSDEQKKMIKKEEKKTREEK